MAVLRECELKHQGVRQVRSVWRISGPCQSPRKAAAKKERGKIGFSRGRNLQLENFPTCVTWRGVASCSIGAPPDSARARARVLFPQRGKTREVSLSADVQCYDIPPVSFSSSLSYLFSLFPLSLSSPINVPRIILRTASSFRRLSLRVNYTRWFSFALAFGGEAAAAAFAVRRPNNTTIID